LDLLTYHHQIEDDVGSAKEQPISNKFDTFTKNEVRQNVPFFIFWYILWQKKI
jgi:hypothetical protein